MKVVLIEPRSSHANVYSKLHMPLLGPVYLGTILKNRGHEVTIYIEDIDVPDYSNLDADVVGISILTSTSKRGYEIAKKFPREKVIIGGVHASLLPGEAMKYARQVVIGEAEEVIVDIIEGRLLDPIVQGKPVQNLDVLPFPDFSLVKGFKKYPMLMPVSTSRGCPFDCSFCSVTKMFGRRYRFRSPENIIQELKSRDANEFFFCDDNFAAYPKRTHTLLNMFLKNRIGKWSCQVRCDAANDIDLLKKMRRSGCKLVCVGFESINHKTLKAYDKGQTVEQIVSAIRSFHKQKIRIHGMFVLGSDDDNIKTIWETMKFAVKEKIDTIQMMILTPFPGTKVYDNLEVENRIFTKDWSLYDGQHIVFKPKLLSAKELQINVLKAYTKFYTMSRFFSMFINLHFRNAMFSIMGYLIIKKWKKHNRNMDWLLDKQTACKSA